jgi:rod shape-determining protein MreC
LSTGRQNVAILVVLLAANLLLMAGGVRGNEGATALESIVGRVSAPVVGIAELVGGGLRGVLRAANERSADRSRTADLERDLRRLSSEMVRLREAEGENRRLRRLLGMREWLAPRSIAASVVTAKLDGGTHLLIVDRGERQGVRPELPVVAWGGAAGRVLSADANRAKVRLLTDVDSGVAGVVQRSRVHGIVEGRAGAPPLELRYVPRYSDVTHGDRVVTSGLDGIFPRGFGIGIVSSILEAPDGGQILYLEPELDYASLEEVLIILEPVAGPLLETGTGADADPTSGTYTGPEAAPENAP